VSGFGAFLGKELRETVHTWRIWVLPAFILFAALSSPLVTFLMPTLVNRLGGLQQGYAITVSDPTAAAAYVEYLSNLGELVLFALVIAYGGIVSSEVRSGTAALALAKPLSRGSFVLAKWVSQPLSARQHASPSPQPFLASGRRRRRSAPWPFGSCTRS
jgi:ABC-2 type transport system permease protein